MSKLYKTYRNARRFTNTTVEAVTLDGVEGFMPFYSLRPVREIAHDIFSDSVSKRHLVVAELPDGLFGSYWYDEVTSVPTSVPTRPIAQTLFFTEQSAMQSHRSTVERYCNDLSFKHEV
jgi:hypothetical protein